MIRSGTTIIGKILSFPLEVGYIHEPFNSGFSLQDKSLFKDRYFRPTDKSKEYESYKEHVSSIFKYNFKLENHYHSNDSILRKFAKTLLGSRGPVNLGIAKNNPFRKKSLIKDPKAIFATEFVYNNFYTLPIIVIRHPISLAASLQRVGWYPKLDKFREEPDVVNDYLANDREILSKNWSSPLLESMAFWRATYRILLSQSEKYPDWKVFTHESFCKSPIDVSKQLYDHMNLSWSKVIEYRIHRLTTGSSAEASGGQAMDLNRNSADIFRKRRDAIPTELRRSIYEVVKDVALQVYSRDSFGID